VWRLRNPFARNLDGFDPRDRIIQLLEAQNALLRGQIELLGGVHKIPRNFNLQPIRKRTAADVTVLTRETMRKVEEDAQEKAERDQTWTPESRETPTASDPTNASPKLSPVS
jgi:hypothetical protein